MNIVKMKNQFSGSDTNPSTFGLFFGRSKKKSIFFVDMPLPL